MRPNRVKQMWREGKPAVGGWLTLGNPLAAEIMAHAGFDWLVVDMQHGAIDIVMAQQMLQAISTTDAVPFVRVPGNDTAVINQALDAGAYGVVVPLVNTPQDAQRAVAACRYPPRGSRSFGPTRARYYGGDDYFQHANDEIAAIVQIETIEAVRQIDAILGISGIDCALIGPADLAISLNLTPGLAVSHPEHVAAVAQTLAACQRRGVAAGFVAGTPEAANQRIAEGFLMVNLTSDAGLVSGGATTALRQVVRQPSSPQP